MIEHMTLKEALTKYIDVEDLRVYFYKGEDFALLENLFCYNNIDSLNYFQKILVDLNLNTQCEVEIFISDGHYIYDEGEIYRVQIRVGKTTSVKSTYRDKFRTEEETK